VLAFDAEMEVRMRHAKDYLPVLVLLGAIGLAGCSSDPTGPAAPPTDYRGVIVGSQALGTIEVLVAHPSGHTDAGTVPVRATLRLASGFEVHHLEGTFDPSGNLLALGGSGWTLRGTISNGLLRGDGTNASGPNVFIAQEDGAGANAVSGYTGGVDLQAGLAIRGGTVVGATRVPGPPVGPVPFVTFTGSFSATDSSLTILKPADPSGPPIGTGRLLSYYITTALVRFDFGPGAISNWSGDRNIGYTGP
jgi:hypothetical protein